MDWNTETVTVSDGYVGGALLCVCEKRILNHEKILLLAYTISLSGEVETVKMAPGAICVNLPQKIPKKPLTELTEAQRGARNFQIACSLLYFFILFMKKSKKRDPDFLLPMAPRASVR